LELIFLTYVNRSGSTYLANLLSKSEEILVCPEAEVLVNVFLETPSHKFVIYDSIKSKLRKHFIQDEKLRYWGLNPDDLRSLKSCRKNFDAFCQILKRYQERIKPNATKIVFKAERLIDIYTRIPSELKKKYNLKFIAIIRDCRAIYNSQKFTLLLNRVDYMSDNLVETSIFWRNFVSICLTYEINDDFFIIKYEDLILNLDKTFSALLKISGIKHFEIYKKGGDLYGRIPQNQLYLHENIICDPIEEKVNDWISELSTEEIFLIEYFAKAGMTRFGYRLLEPKINKIHVIPPLIYFLIKFYYNTFKRKFYFKLSHLFNVLFFRFLIPKIQKVISYLRYLKYSVFGFFYRKYFANVKYFCFFIGYPRSGHSLLGALLDAHPRVTMGIEVDVMNLINSGYTKNQIFYFILNNSKNFTKKLSNTWTGYSYRVPNQHQGRVKYMEVIGDKKGGRSTIWLEEDFSLYHKLVSTIKCPVKVLHVIRNPFDNISTMIKRNLQNNEIPYKELFLNKIEAYFNKVKINSQIKKCGQINILDIYHEDFIADPVRTLERILLFLELNSSKDYLMDCSSIVFDNPHKSRFDLDWPDDLKKMVQSEINKYFFLKRYSFND